MKEATKTIELKYVPYQMCPVCVGTGKVIADGFTSTVYATCTVCNGNKIIVPFIVSEAQV